MEDCLEAPSLGSLIDIRRGSQGADLKKRLLKRTPKELPSLVLWDDKGIELYERLKVECDDYYPSRHEDNLIGANASEITAAIPNNGTLVELGSGYECDYTESVQMC